MIRLSFLVKICKIVKSESGKSLRFKYPGNTVVMKEDSLGCEFLNLAERCKFESVGLFFLKVDITFVDVHLVTVDIDKVVIAFAWILSLRSRMTGFAHDTGQG